ncbi:MAG: DUF3638 domain-containing protein, partial [Waddliaceae bacterium]
AVQKVEGVAEESRKKLFLQNITAGLSMVRAYEPDTTNLHKQWFEYANHYLYRSIQLQKLREVTRPDAEEILAEMPTGFGKTKTLIPSLNYDRAQADKLVVNTWPTSLEMTNASDIREQMGASFGNKVDRLTFDRASAFSTESLKHLYTELKTDKKEGRPVNIRSETLRAFELHALLFLNQASEQKKRPAELNKQISYFLKILRLIRTEGWSTIDESHSTLNPLDKLIYTIGNPKMLPSEQVDVLEEFFDILTEGGFDQIIHFRDNQQSFVSEEVYDRDIAPKLAEHFMKKLAVDLSNKASYEDFVLGRTGEIPSWLEKHPKKELIALVKGLLTQVLKTSMKGSVDEDYGRSKLHIKKIEYAIAYASANTPKETASSPSQFKNPHETMCKTYIAYLYKGLDKSQVHKFIDFLKQQAMLEVRDGGSLDKTHANAFFQEIVPTSDKLLMTLKDQDIENLYPQICKNKKALFYYIRNIIVPQLKIYPDSLVSTAHNFKSQFASSLSDSATPQDTATHGPDTHFVPMKGTSGQVTHLLLTKCKDPKALHEVGSIKPAEVLDETLGIIKDNPRIHATIDVGALYKGLSNYEVAQKMRGKFEASHEVDAILFFDEKEGLFKIMDIATGQVHDPSESKFEPEMIQTFYDQSRCFGSDVKQAVDAVGLLMAGKGTTKAVVGQGAGRMRQWHQDQSVEVIYPEAIRKEMFGEDSPDIKKLLVYWIANQAKQEADKNYQSQLQQMDNEIRRALIDKILGIRVGDRSGKLPKNPDVKGAINLFKHFKSEFFGHETTDPWALYASIPEDKDAKECLGAHQKSCLAKVKKLKGLNRRERKYISRRLQAYPEKWETMALPKKVTASGPGLGMECEVLQEVEVEAEIEIQAQVKEDLQERIPSQWPANLDLFSSGWEKPKKQHVFFKKLANKLTRWVPSHPVRKVFRLTTVGAAIAGVAAIALAVANIAIPTFAIIGAGAAFGLVVAIATSLLKRKVHKGNAVYRVKDLMSLYLPSKVNKGARIFSPNFLVSNNFYVQKTQTASQSPQIPLSVEQKPLHSVLVICDDRGKGKKDIKVMAIDQNDSPFFHRKLQEDNEATSDEAASARKRKVGIYDLQNGKFTVQGKNRFEDADRKEPELQKLLAEAKFLGGEIHYTEEEMKHFGEHVRKVGKDVGYGILQSLFMDHILRLHPLHRRCMDNKINPKPIAKVLGLVKPTSALA